MVYDTGMPLVAVKNKYQVVIPAKVRKAAGVVVGDFLEADFADDIITLTPQAVIDKSRIVKLPRGVRDGLAEVRKGRVAGPFYSVAELRKDLES